MKKMKIFIAAFMVCSMFMMPVKANDTVTVSFEATDNKNEGVLSIENIESVNALSLNITLDTNAKLIEVVPNEDLLKQGAKFNYRYHEDTKALNLYITGKQAFAYDQKLPLAYLHFENEENTSVKLSLNPDKAGLKLVYDTFAQTLNESNGLVFTASQLSVSGSKTEEEIPDKEEISYPAAQVIDKTTNVTIEAEEGILPKGTNANISQMKDEKKLETIKKKLSELSEKFTVYTASVAKWNAVKPSIMAKIFATAPEGAGQGNRREVHGGRRTVRAHHERQRLCEAAPPLHRRDCRDGEVRRADRALLLAHARRRHDLAGHRPLGKRNAYR